MLKSVIGILVSVIVFLIGLVIVLTESFATDAYWIAIGLMGAGIASTGIFVTGKVKSWF